VGNNKYHLQQEWANFLANPNFMWQWYGHFTFKHHPHAESANKTWMLWIHRINRACFGTGYWKYKHKGVIWARGTETQNRGSIHYHAIIGNLHRIVPDRFKWMEVWNDYAGFSRIHPYFVNMGAEHYMSKSTYAWKRGEIDLSETIKYHIDAPLLDSTVF